jgi:hypothetical protein
MLSAQMQFYISNLPIAPLQATPQPQDDAPPNLIDVNNLPGVVVTGSNLIEFSDDASPAIRTSVALSLLAAQRVASEDPATKTPEQWIDRHNTVLTNLDWLAGTPKLVRFEFKKFDEAVNQAIIPFLSDAFGGSPNGGNLILNALNQLKDDSKNSRWFALFDRESQRFQVTEYQFSVVGMTGDQVNLKLASTRFEASFGRTQVLFIHLTKQHASFEGVSQGLSAKAADVADMRDSLKVKLAGFAKTFIHSLSI